MTLQVTCATGIIALVLCGISARDIDDKLCSLGMALLLAAAQSAFTIVYAIYEALL